MKYFLLFIVALTMSTGFAQETSFSDDVKLCIKNNGTYAYYEDVVDQMFGVLEDQFKSQEVPKSIWDELKEVKLESLDELSHMIVSAYKAHFTLEDVQNMNALYKTAAGKNMFKSPEHLTEDDKLVLNKFYKSDTGQKIIGSQDSMNGAMSQISELWSSQLYKSVIDKLSAKGYTLN